MRLLLVDFRFAIKGIPAAVPLELAVAKSFPANSPAVNARIFFSVLSRVIPFADERLGAHQYRPDESGSVVHGKGVISMKGAR
jgi:hypothetical protein